MKVKKFTNKTAIEAQPKEKVYKLSTGFGFYLLVKPTGAKYWQYDYRYGGKQATISLGNFLETSLEEAKAQYVKARELLKQGINPSEERKRIKEDIKKKVTEEKQTFEAVAKEWHKKASVGKAPGYAEELMQRLENHIFPFIGNKKIKEMKTADLLPPLQAKEKLKKYEMAHRLLSIIARVIKYARVSGYIEYNIAADLNEALVPVSKKNHRPCIKDPVKAGILLNDIERYNGSITVKYALKIMPYVFVRSKELLGAKWEEINFDEAQWLIPAERMKRKKAHLVPLSTQVIELLRELKNLSPSSEYIFPSKSGRGFITAEGFRKSLETIGYKKDEMCIHGFRGMASTLLNESGKYRGDVIEAQLSHSDKNAVREAYNHAEYFTERCQLMQEWADYLDSLKADQAIASK